MSTKVMASVPCGFGFDEAKEFFGFTMYLVENLEVDMQIKDNMS